MKRSLFILACVISCVPLFAQSYQYVPIPTTGAVWKATNRTAVMRGANCSKYQYKLAGGSTVNGADTFYKIELLGAYKSYDIYHSTPEQIAFVNSCSSNPFEYPIEADNSLPGIYWMIEKDKRVYVLDSPSLDTSVHKAYLDFSLSQVGQKSSPSSIRPDDTVMHIDTISINGSLRKRIIARVFSDHAFGGVVDTMIEGIGSTTFGLGFEEMFRSGLDNIFHSALICFSVNNQQEYVYNNSACADIWPLDVDDVSIEKLPVFSPNPFGHRLTGSLPGGGTLRICNVSGMSVCTHIYAPGENIDLNTTDWQPGLYIATVESNNVKKAFRLVKL